MVDQIYAHLDEHESVVGVYLDLEKVLDTVNRAILLRKLYNSGIRGVVYEWFRNYFHNRTQFVTVNECNSEVRNIKHGVPQGSLWDPLLFLIYLNDIHEAVPGDKLKLYADDTNLFVCGSILQSVADETNILLSKLNKWFIANKLSLSLEKKLVIWYLD